MDKALERIPSLTPYPTSSWNTPSWEKDIENGKPGHPKHKQIHGSEQDYSISI